MRFGPWFVLATAAVMAAPGIAPDIPMSPPRDGRPSIGQLLSPAPKDMAFYDTDPCRHHWRTGVCRLLLPVRG
ncbi:hypothetical protein EC912_11079 [Luteibacter rhizovicinus]|uniref:Uncharacterized protein n=1 Tax=Luteibacter rhizovicinus TaxID=242606 RepID=A0A4V2W3E6_9GAMM|nr:hypothetical protein [Luteibacter rhizovicinus]TCV91649.1 hypothetical protein EC912_11079 [Luteibacter rhizovicinus]